MDKSVYFPADLFGGVVWQGLVGVCIVQVFCHNFLDIVCGVHDAYATPFVASLNGEVLIFL